MKQPGPSAFRSNIIIAFLILPNTGRQQGSNAYAALGDARKAIDYYDQQLVITNEIGDRRERQMHPGIWVLHMRRQETSNALPN
ncbi:MAG TPA: tetratricopeptide repeat protein [Methanothrix sp.]|nr:tetratricopeptide repeat protein [Methanothrix sp.]